MCSALADRVALDEEEQQAMDDLLACMGRITSWGLDPDARNLPVELAAAVHVIQGFIIQRMLQRVAPGEWGRWYTDV